MCSPGVIVTNVHKRAGLSDTDYEKVRSAPKGENNIVHSFLNTAKQHTHSAASVM
jgi:hypothetical protein